MKRLQQIKRTYTYQRLKHLENCIENESSVSWGDLAFMQSNHKTIFNYFPGSIKLAEWSGIPENEWFGGLNNEIA